MNTKYEKIGTDELQSRTISFLRFPLIVGVVLIHSVFGESYLEKLTMTPDIDFPIYTTVSYLFSQIISRIAVPLFFFFSGFLFFYRTSFSSQTYIQKLKKRSKTLLIPYLIWNLITLAFTFTIQLLVPNLLSGRNKLISDYTATDFLWTFWDTKMIDPLSHEHHFPIDFPLWFIRDLMIVVLLSPVIYFLIKKLKHYAVAALGILWMFGWWINVTGFSSAAVFFFSFGAYFSIYGKNFVEAMKPFLSISAVTYTILTIAELCLRGYEWTSYLHNANILVGIVLSVSLSAHFISKGTWKVCPFLAESSFFIYVYHGMITGRLTALFSKFLPPSDMVLLFIYLFCPAITIGAGLLAYRCLKRYLPKTTAFVTGGR